MVDGGINPLYKKQELPPFLQPKGDNEQLPEIFKPRKPGGERGPEIEELLEKNPELKKLFDKTLNNLNDQSPETKFNIKRIIILLIELCRTLQDAAVVMAGRLDVITDRLTGYSKMITQVPVVTKGQVIFSIEGADDKEKSKNDADERGLYNQKFSNMLEAVRANKGLDEDRAKKVQTLMQSMKDANASTSDFITSFIDLLRGMNSKLFR